MATVVILGGTGELGHHVSTAFLDEFRSAFPTVRITTRDPSSEKAKKLAAKGAEIYPLSEALDVVFSGATVVVNILPSAVCKEMGAEGLVKAMLQQGVKVYFPSDFGLDHRVLDFPGFWHSEWTTKEEMAEKVKELSQGKLKIVRISPGVFAQWIFKFGPKFGPCDLATNTVNWAGSSTRKLAMTDLSDIGRATAQLAILALDPATSSSVPEIVRIAGNNVDAHEICAAIERVKGTGPGTVNTIDPAPIKQKLRENHPNPMMSIFEYALVNIAEGAMDYSKNDNELVNPGQKLWKWKTADDVLRSL